MAPRHRHHRPCAALFLVLALAGAACGDDGSDGGDDPAPAADEEARTTPLAAFLGWDAAEGVGPDGLTDQQREQERLVQQLVAECMRDQGFDYVPEDVSASAAASADGPFSLEPEAFAAQYGYGISTIDGAAALGPSADPNLAALDAMSPEARAAYERALYGEAGARPLPGWIEPVPGATEVTEAPAEDPGCYQASQDEVYGRRGAPAQGLAAVYAELEPELTALQDRIDRDPRVLAAAEAWADCMADGGHPGYTAPHEPPEQLRERFRDLTSSAAGPDELSAFRSLEVATATADLACRVDFDEEQLAVRMEVEEEFVEEHRDLLERYRDLAGLAQEGG